MAPFFRGLVALLLVLLEPAIPFDPFPVPPLYGLAVVLAATLSPLVVSSNRLPGRVRSLVPLGGFALAVVGAGWVGFVERSGLAGVPGFGAALLFGPYLVSEAAHALSEARRDTPRARDGLERGVSDEVRGVILGVSLPIAPYVAFLLYLQILHILTGVGYWLDVFPSLGMGLAGTFLLLVFATSSYVIPSLMGAAVLPSGPLRAHLEGIAAEAGFRPHEIFCWHAARGAANAFVTGLLPMGRSVFLSHGLLEALSPEELGAVFAHEVGHVRRRHSWILGALAAAFLLLATGLEASGPMEDLKGWGELPVAALSGFALLGFWGLLFPWMSRRIERDADLYAASRVSAMPRALLRVAAWNGMNLEKRGWRHFSIRRRLEEISWANSPERRRHEHEFAAVCATAAILMLAGTLAWGSTLPDELVTGQARHALARGELPRAERLFDDAIARRPFDRTIIFDLGRTLLFEGELPKAIACIGAVLQPDGGTGFHYAQLSGDFWRLGFVSVAARLAEEYRHRSLGTRGSRRDLARLLSLVQEDLAARA